MQVLKSPFFIKGFRQMVPITTGVIPFGAVMGTVFFNAKISFVKAMTMNVLVYAGASQLAAVELMDKHAALIVVVLTGLVINLRFLLYSAGLAVELQGASWGTKLLCAHTLTDQSYAVMLAHHDEFKKKSDAIEFYLGTAVCMLLVWHASVVAGYVFGNFAPASWNLDFAVPLSFLALVIPTLKNKTYWLVALFSTVVSILCYSMPFKTGLITTALLSIALAIFLTRKKEV